MKRRATSSALAPTRNRNPTNKCTKKVCWGKEEDELLFKLMENVTNPNWPIIASNFPLKSTQQVTERWEKVLNPELIKGSWTREEDETIIKFVAENGSKNWTKLSTLLPGRIGKQCRERWRNHLDPSINHSMWSTEEDLTLMELHQKYGNQWVKISTFMPGRSDNAIKNRWNSTLRRIDKDHHGNIKYTKITNSVVEADDLVKPEDDIYIPSAPQSPFISIISPFGNLISPGVSKVSAQLDSIESPAISLENNRAKFLTLLEKEKD